MGIGGQNYKIAETFQRDIAYYLGNHGGGPWRRYGGGPWRRCGGDRGGDLAEDRGGGVVEIRGGDLAEVKGVGQGENQAWTTGWQEQERWHNQGLLEHWSLKRLWSEELNKIAVVRRRDENMENGSIG